MPKTFGGEIIWDQSPRTSQRSEETDEHIRVLIADDHGVVRQGLTMYLKLDPELEVVGEASNGEEALTPGPRPEPDVVLMDVLMPVMDGIEATEKIKAELPEVEVVALTSVLDDGAVTGAVRAGAMGYLLKNTKPSELCRAIKGAAAGQVQLDPEAAARLMREMRAPEKPEALTARETEVLELLRGARRTSRSRASSSSRRRRSRPTSLAS